MTTGLYLPGTSGEYVSTPDDASLDLTTSAEFVIRTSLVNWAPAGGAYLLAKKGSYGVRIEADSKLSLLLSSGGLQLKTSALALPFSDGEWYWLKVTFNDGATPEIGMYYAADQESEPSSWTTHDEALTTIKTFAVTTNTLLIGTYDGTSLETQMTVAHVIVRDAPDGTLVAEFDASLPIEPRYRDSTGKIWTINGSAYAWEGVA